VRGGFRLVSPACVANRSHLRETAPRSKAKDRAAFSGWVRAALFGPPSGIGSSSGGDSRCFRPRTSRSSAPRSSASGTATVSLSQAVSSVGVTHPPQLVHFDGAHYTVAALTQQLRLRAQVLADATARITFIFGLHPVTVAGETDVVTYTAGAAVASSTTAIASPSASTVTTAVNSDFTVPADGGHMLCVVTSGTIATTRRCPATHGFRRATSKDQDSCHKDYYWLGRLPDRGRT
jgi:hypothetical protein